MVSLIIIIVMIYKLYSQSPLRHAQSLAGRAFVELSFYGFAERRAFGYIHEFFVRYFRRSDAFAKRLEFVITFSSICLALHVYPGASDADIAVVPVHDLRHFHRLFDFGLLDVLILPVRYPE
jgi:hypothetical protein